jgi:hypothetical protein
VPADAGPGDVIVSPDVTIVSAPAQPYLGSPLCNASETSRCYPDELSTFPTTARGCSRAPDGGAYDPDAGYADAGLACHVTHDDGGVPTPVCLPAGSNQEGASCRTSADCTAGSECVGVPGVCRHYCCSGSDPCTASEFCDIWPKAQDPSTQVPVCVPIRTCGLLGEWSDAGSCPPSETCTVARDETGATSCVPIGAAGEGASCTTDHCAEGLVCLGLTCFTLCHTANPAECAVGQTCMAALPVFPSPAVGVCETQP